MIGLLLEREEERAKKKARANTQIDGQRSSTLHFACTHQSRRTCRLPSRSLASACSLTWSKKLDLFFDNTLAHYNSTTIRNLWFTHYWPRPPHLTKNEVNVSSRTALHSIHMLLYGSSLHSSRAIISTTFRITTHAAIRRGCLRTKRSVTILW